MFGKHNNPELVQRINLVLLILLLPLSISALTDSELIDSYDYSYYNGSINVTAFSDRMADSDADGINDTLIFNLQTDATSGTYTFIAEIQDKNGLYANETSKTFSAGDSNISINIPSELLSQAIFNYTIRAIGSDSNLVYRSNKQQTQSYTNYEPGVRILSFSDQNVGNNFIRINVYLNANVSTTANVTITLSYNDTSISKTEQKSLSAGNQNISIDFDNETIKRTHYSNKFTIDSILIGKKSNDTNINLSTYSYETFAKTSYIKSITDGRVDPDGDNLSDFLELNFTIEAKSNGVHNLTYDLYDEFSNYVTSVNASQSLSVGTNTMQTRINGSEVYKSKISGPYLVSTTKLQIGNVTDSVIDWHVINSSSYTEFERPPLPDLSLTMNSSINATNNQTGLTIDVFNQGQAPAFNVFLDIFDNQSFEGNASIPFANISNHSVFYYTIANTSNATLFIAVVDFDNLVDEADETNNIDQSLTEENDAFAVTLIYPINDANYTISSVDINWTANKNASWCFYGLEGQQNTSLGAYNKFNQNDDCVVDDIDVNITRDCFDQPPTGNCEKADMHPLNAPDGEINIFDLIIVVQNRKFLNQNITLEGLPSGQHTIRIWANDSNGVWAHSENNLFTINDNLSPSWLTFPYNKTTTNSSIKISDTTNEASNRTYTVGTCPSYAGVAAISNSTLQTAKDQTFGSLSSGTQYCFNMTVSDVSGNKNHTVLSVTTATSTGAGETSQLNVSSLAPIFSNASNHNFRFLVNNTGGANASNVNWSLNTGENIISALALTNITSAKHIFVFTQYDYAQNGSFMVNASATDGQSQDSETISIWVGDTLFVENLALMNLTSTSATMKFEIGNALQTNLTNVTWTFDTKNSAIVNSTSLSLLQPGKKLFVFIGHNYSSGGSYNANATAINATLTDSETLVINV